NIYGSPKDKKQLTDEIINTYGYHPKEMIFIGDALSDFEAAKCRGLYFILRRHPDNRELFENYDSFSINDFTTFDSIFNEISKL
ncbi:MAG TPA: HAD hydrolase-like protein, partial [Thermoclostridium sp.]|nr:HAD hydrolase-like protein [Thermoclostridium sp.]